MDEFRAVHARANDLVAAEYATHSGTASERADIERRFQGLCAQLRSLMRSTEMAVDEADSEEESRAYIQTLSDQKRQYEALLHAYRSAAISRKEMQSQRVEQARNELLNGSNAAEKRKQWKTEADLMAASRGVTESLSRTKNMLAQELEHSGSQLAAIELSQERLGKTNKEYESQHGKLKVAQGLIRVIDWQNKSERYMLWAGLGLFCATAAYILQKRVVYFVPESLRPVAVVRYAMRMMRDGRGGTKEFPTEEVEPVEDVMDDLHTEL